MVVGACHVVDFKKCFWQGYKKISLNLVIVGVKLVFLMISLFLTKSRWSQT